MTTNISVLPTTLWYGERGIVNSVVTHISAMDNPAEGTRKLLDAIVWADGGKPGWISNVIDVNLIVEISMSDFGNPDLMIVCRVDGDDKPYCIFVEAKAICYQFSMANNSEGMSPGYNSTINGQISLKYRLAKALSRTKPNDNEIVEPTDLHRTYVQDLRDYRKTPRHLKKQNVIDVLKKLHLIGLDEDRFYFVAFTWDNSDHVFFRDSAVTPDNLPMLLDEKNSNVYGDVAPRLGWLGYRNLEKSVDLGNNSGYLLACGSMFDTSEPTKADYDRLQSASVISCDGDFIEELRALFLDASGSDSKFFVAQHRGSYSIGIANTTLAKIIPLQMDNVFVGVRSNKPVVQDSLNLRHIRSIQGVHFHGVYLDPSDIAGIKSSIGEVLEDFAKLAKKSRN